MNKLKQLLTDSLSLVFGNLDIVFRAAGSWFALQFLLMLILQSAIGGTDPQAANPGAVATFALLALVFSLVASASISVAWHRFGLLEERPGAIQLKFGGLEFAFVMRMLLLALIMVGIWLVVALIHGLLGAPALTGVAAIVVFIFAIPVFFRLSLILPATAVERPISLGEAYSMGEGLGWYMFLATFLLSLPFVLGGLALEYLVGLAASGLPLLILQIKVMILNLLVQIIVTVLGISVLTAGYRMATGQAEGANPDPGVFQ
ncbi:MAG: hypothetical protein JJ866_09540 [Roseibium sp.]|uniref:hypothetical protein n=1 Tax=Roseibium sp. TaxID=1936156 RepID=UPI001B0ACEC6|nr:hypothetical protein [Roseibium sp.]MBO6892171.1 hypothetical protein [Roseibium sp.]MBO6931006.1 hypothetical protein [Roseibium sp.]